MFRKMLIVCKNYYFNSTQLSNYIQLLEYSQLLISLKYSEKRVKFSILVIERGSERERERVRGREIVGVKESGRVKGRWRDT